MTRDWSTLWFHSHAHTTNWCHKPTLHCQKNTFQTHDRTGIEVNTNTHTHESISNDVILFREYVKASQTMKRTKTTKETSAHGTLIIIRAKRK